jgi:hypothetical protein
MKARHHSLARKELAFSLIEIMVAVALMTVIVLGLLSVFNTTQKAFRSSMAQVDYLATGRAAADILARDLVEITPSQMSQYGNGGMTNCLNFYAELSPSFANPLLQGLPGTVSPTVPGAQDQRINIVENFFFLTRANLTWSGIGYAVLPTAPNSGVGTLYRFSTNTTKSGAQSLSGLFYQAVQIEVQNALNNVPITNLNGFEVSRIADGVVHLQVRPFATNGFPVVVNPYNRTFLNGYFRYSHMTNDYRQLRNVVAVGVGGLPEHLNCYFYSNAVPAFVELELGMVEQSVLDRVKGMGVVNAVAQRQYLSNHVAQVHLFRQRIPIRNVDYSAYQ